MLVKSVIILVLLTIAWLLGGRKLTLALDWAVTVRTTSLPVGPLRYDGGGWVIGNLAMTFGTANNLSYPLILSSDPAGRAILSTGHQAFILGPRTSDNYRQGWPDFDFAPEAGDSVSFRTSQSLLPWPTPFEINWLSGPSPWWKRYVYYRLVWKKRTGAKLEMNWRYDQRWYAAKGWSAPVMQWNSETGLLWVEIWPESEGPEGAVVEYIARTKGWTRNQYRIEERGPDMFAVVYLADERSPNPGAGQSVELRLDCASHRVVKEIGGQ